MEEVRRTARKAATLQLIAHNYRRHARSGSADGDSLFAEADALDRLAAYLLSGTTAISRDA